MSSLKKARNLLNALYYNEKQAAIKDFAPEYIKSTFNLFIKLVDAHLSNLQKELQNPNPRPWDLLDDEESFKLAKGLRNARRNIWEYLETQKEKEETQDDNAKEN